MYIDGGGMGIGREGGGIGGWLDDEDEDDVYGVIGVEMRMKASFELWMLDSDCKRGDVWLLLSTCLIDWSVFSGFNVIWSILSGCKGSYCKGMGIYIYISYCYVYYFSCSWIGTCKVLLF